jgi:hypothetical protein
MDFLNRLVVSPSNPNLAVVEKSFIYLGEIRPNRVIKNKNVFEIVYLNPMFILNGFVVITENELVQNILVFGYHPNKDPDTSLYCLPNRKKQNKFDENFFKLLLTNLKTFYLDECFYIPSINQLKYKKMKSIYVKLNRGE